MTKLQLIVLVLLPSLWLSPAPAPQQGAGTFTAYDVFVDSGASALGAYQFEWSVAKGAASIVGVEGGDGVFAKAPYYDPAALQGGRIVIAAFATAKDLPQGRTRVARLHLHEDGDVAATYAATLTACADGAGAALTATMTWQKKETK